MVIKADQIAQDLGYLGEVVIGYARLGKGDAAKTIIADLAYRKVYYYDQDNSQVPAIAPVVEGINILSLNNPQLAGTRIRIGYPNYNHKQLHMLGFDSGEGLQAVGGLTPQEQLTAKTIYPSVGDITNFRGMAQTPPDLTVFIGPSPYYDADGNYQIWGGSSTDPTAFSDLIDALTSGQHQMAVGCIDITTGEPVILTNTASDGTAADKALFDWTTIATEIAITANYIPCIAVHLYEGQTEITEDDIYRSADPRAAFGKQAGNSGSLTVTDGSTTVTDVTSVTFNGTDFTVTDLTGGAVQVDLVTPSAQVFPKRSPTIFSYTFNQPTGTPGMTPVAANINHFFYNYNTTPALNDTFTFGVLLAAGTYNLRVEGSSNANRGVLDWYVGATIQGGATGQDWSSGIGDGEVKTGTIVIPSSGYYVITGKVSAAGSGSNYYWALTCVDIYPSTD